MEDVIREYLVAEKRAARVFIPKVGTISTDYRPPYKGRNMYTGKVIEVPAQYSLRFNPSDGDNSTFFAWLASQYDANLSVVERQLTELGERAQSEFDTRRRFELQELGEFLLKRRPPKYGQRPSTGDFVEAPAHTQIVFVPQQSLQMVLDNETAKYSSYFDKLPIHPSAIPKGLSSFSLDRIPSPVQWWKLCQTLAVLEATRYRAIPSLETGLDYAAMSNGQGDECKLFFMNRDALILGFAHESPMGSWGGAQRPWPGTFEGLPDHLRERLSHDYLEAEPVSFCIWFRSDTETWHKGTIKNFPDSPSDDPDGSEYMLSYFPFEPDEYLNSEPAADLMLVKEIYNHTPLSSAMAANINPKVDLETFARTGYPIQKA